MNEVKVEWIDTSHCEELSRVAALQLKPITSIVYGELLLNNENVVIASGHDLDDDSFRDILSIPRINVRKITELEVKE